AEVHAAGLAGAPAPGEHVDLFLVLAVLGFTLDVPDLDKHVYGHGAHLSVVEAVAEVKKSSASARLRGDGGAGAVWKTSRRREIQSLATIYLLAALGRRQLRDQAQRHREAFELVVRPQEELGAVVAGVALDLLD